MNPVGIESDGFMMECDMCYEVEYVDGHEAATADLACWAVDRSDVERAGWWTDGYEVLCPPCREEYAT